MPDTPPTVGGSGCLTRTGSPFHKVTVEKARPFLLVNDDGPQPSPQVCIVPSEFGRAFLGANPEVPQPALKIFA